MKKRTEDKLVICTGVKRGKCKNKNCDHHDPHPVVRGPSYHGPSGHAMRTMPLAELEKYKTTTEYCNRFGYCRIFPESKNKRPVAWPRAIEVKCE